MRRVTQILTKLTASPEGDLAVSLDLVKQQRRVSRSSTAMDDLFTLWIVGVTELFQEETGRQCVITPYEWRLDCFPVDRYIELPRPPLQAVQAVEYLASDGTWTTFDSDNYTVHAPIGAHAAPGRIVLNTGSDWPTTIEQDGAVRISFTCGYDVVPSLIQSCLLLLIGHLHRNGEEVVSGSDAASLAQLPMGAAAMMRAFRHSALVTQAPWEVPWRV